MTMTKSERPFLPAAGHDLFLPLYDPLTKLLGMDRRRQALVEQAEFAPRHRVLDVGCGTGSLAILIKELHPTVDVVALDPDPKALDRARRKANRAGLSIRFDRGFASALGYADQTFDRVVSSMMFHHLPNDDRLPALQEFKRVLKPGGRMELLDFGGPDSDLHGIAGRLVHSHRRLHGNTPVAVLRVMAAAGFTDARRVRTESTIFGRLEFYQASAPGASARAATASN
jgi:ubiquinone/menaquinone biosynthesis C-methylase UbiE